MNTNTDLLSFLTTDTEKTTPLNPQIRAHPESSTGSTTNSDIDNSISMEIQYEDKMFKTPASNSKHIVKKSKNNHTFPKEAIDTALEPIRKIITIYPKDYEFNFLQLKSFIENTYGTNNIGELISSFTNDSNTFSKKLKSLYPFLTSRRVKNRFSRIVNQIETNS